MLETLTDLGNQFFGIERLWNIVIAFQVEPFQTVGLFRPVCQKEDKHAQVTLTDKPRQLKTIHHWHIDVEQHQIGLGGRECLPTFAAILCVSYFVALHL